MKSKLFVCFAMVTLLAGCSYSTLEGGENSLASDIKVAEFENHYTLPASVLEEVNEGKTKIIVTEYVSDFGWTYSEAVAKISAYIQNVADEMAKHGYTIISSDTNSMGRDGSNTGITLIFEKVEK